MKLKRSDCLIYFSTGQTLSGYNFVTGSEFEADTNFIEFLAGCSDWQSRNSVESLAQRFYANKEGQLIEAALAVDALLESESEEAVAEALFNRDWQFSLPSAILHFAVSDREYIDVLDAEDQQREKSKTNPRPPLYLENKESADRPLHRCTPQTSEGVTTLLTKRRTLRECPSSQISFAQLSACLFAGLGITGWTENVAGRLPLKMSPSGGATNPFEAYIYCNKVNDLARGFYHYSAVDHTLQLCAEIDGLTGSQLLGGQDWADNAGCIAFLCADLRRPMWKYQFDDNVYRTMLIEAGHIGQNMMILGTEMGLSLCPSAAIDHKTIHEVLALDGITNSAIYSLSFMEAQKFNGPRPMLESNL